MSTVIHIQRECKRISVYSDKVGGNDGIIKNILNYPAVLSAITRKPKEEDFRDPEKLGIYLSGMIIAELREIRGLKDPMDPQCNIMVHVY